MRVAFVLAEYPVRNETFIQRELAELSAQGHEAAIFALRRTGDVDQGGAISWPVYYRPSLWSPGLWATQLWWVFSRPGAVMTALAQVLWGCLLRPRVLLAALNNFLGAAHFAKIAHDQDVERIHSHFAFVPGIVGQVTSRLAGKRFSFTAHAWDIYAEPTMLRECIQAADRVVTCTQHNLTTLKSVAPGCHDRMHVRYHGIPSSLFRPSQAEKARPPLILCVGRLVEKKGHRYIISACEALKRRGVALRCAIVGDGPLRERLERRVRARGLARQIQFTGRLPEREVAELLAKAAALVCPSVVAGDGDRDGIPNVVLEAMACGVPVVASRVSGIPEIVEHGVTGLLTEPRDAEELAARIEDVLRDPYRAAERCERGLSRIEEDFCLRKNVADLASLIFDDAPGQELDLRPTVYDAVKRVLDLAAAGVALLALLLPMGFLALLIKFDSRGPVFFAHDRIGKAGRRFRIYKFRTLAADAKPYQRTPRHDHDSRITRFGHFVRNHGLDELPQLLNVLKGDMSLVGPRPEMPFIVERYTATERRRLSVVPGITGLWQVDAPHDVPIHEHLEYDLDYIEHRSLWLDLSIMARTVPIVFGKRRKRKHVT